MLLWLLLTHVVGGVQHRNPLAEWQSKFSSGWALANPGRRLSAAPSVEFSQESISHRGYVDIRVFAPQLVESARDCNVSYIALYSPPDADLNRTTPIRYQAISWNKSFCETGNAIFRFQLNNLHTSGYRAYLLQGGVERTPVMTPFTQLFRPNLKPWMAIGGLRADPAAYLPSKVLAFSSRDLIFNNWNEPTHIRITAGRQPGLYIVSWNQAENTTGGYVRYSNNTSQNAWEGGVRVVAKSAWTLSKNDVCGHGPASGPGFRSMGTQFSAELTLREQGTIYYAVGSDGNFTSATFRFTVPLLPGTRTNSPQEWVIYADQGVGYTDDSHSVRNLNNGRTSRDISIAVENVSLSRTLQGVLVSGDVTYADGYFAQTEEYLDMTQTTFASTVCLISAGNHESAWYRGGSSNLSFPNAFANYNSADNSTVTADFWSRESNPDISISSGGECGVSFKIWPEVNATPAKPWYAWSAGLLTMVIWSSEHDFTTGSEQWNWLNATLAQVDRQLTPWLMVTAHRPMYLSSIPDDLFNAFRAESALFVQHIEPLYVRYNVTFTMSGHHHSTQRSCATLNYSCELRATNSTDGYAEYLDPPYPIHWVIGNAGANPDIFANNFPFTLFQTPSAAFGLVTIRSARILELQLIDPLTRIVLDKVRILRGSAPEVDADCFDDSLISNFFSNCTDVDFGSRNGVCSAECQQASLDLEQAADFPMECLENYANKSQRLRPATVNTIKALLDRGDRLCPVMYSAGSFVVLSWLACFISVSIVML